MDLWPIGKLRTLVLQYLVVLVLNTVSIILAAIPFYLHYVFPLLKYSFYTRMESVIIGLHQLVLEFQVQ